jgi:2-methylcitrate dehydratase PrpD
MTAYRRNCSPSCAGAFSTRWGVAAIGLTTDLSVMARKGAVALFGVGGAGPARMLMDGRSVSPAGAAMAGAFMIDSIDAHDGTSPNKGHAGSAVFPALLAVADALRSGGQAIGGRDFAVALADTAGLKVAASEATWQVATQLPRSVSPVTPTSRTGHPALPLSKKLGRIAD